MAGKKGKRESVLVKCPFCKKLFIGMVVETGIVHRKVRK